MVKVRFSSAFRTFIPSIQIFTINLFNIQWRNIVFKFKTIYLLNADGHGGILSVLRSTICLNRMPFTLSSNKQNIYGKERKKIWENIIVPHYHIVGLGHCSRTLYSFFSKIIQNAFRKRRRVLAKWFICIPFLIPLSAIAFHCFFFFLCIGCSGFWPVDFISIRVAI